MKKLLLVLTLINCLSMISLNAQEELFYGKVTLADFDQQAPPDDPEAEAVILCDKGHARFVDTETGFVVKFERYTRILILQESGFDWAEIEIPLYEDKKNDAYEVIRNLKARTYNVVDGEVVITRLDKKNVYEERYSKNVAIEKFAMPAVKEGSIIEFSYELFSPFVFNLPDWEFQNRIPTLFSKYEVGITPFYEYTFLLQGAKSFDFYESNDEFANTKRFAGVEYYDRVHTYVMKNIPAFKDETFITSVEDYIIKIDFQLSRIQYPTGGDKKILTTWEEMNDTFLKNDRFGTYLKKSESQAKKILEEEFALDGFSNEEKFEAIVKYVKTHFHWDGRSSDLALKSVREFLKSHNGNSAEINLFLTGMLRAAGFEAKPVILSTRGHGKITVEYPYAHFFNYVIPLVELDGKYVLTDGTEPLLACNRIPARCINQQGLIIDKDGEGWVKLANSITFPSISQKTMILHPDPDEDIIFCELVEQSNEYMALSAKKGYAHGADQFIESREGLNLENIDITEVVNNEEIGEPFVIKYTADYPLEYVNDKILIPPFLSFPISENKLKQPDRRYPVDMNFKKHWYFSSTIQIPDGYELLEHPENVNINNDLVQINLKTEVMGSVLLCIGVIKFKKAVYQPENYKRLRAFYMEIVKRFNDRIVLNELALDN